MKLWGLFFLFWFQSHGKGIEGFSVDDEYDDKCGEDLSHHFCNDKNTFHDDPCSGVCHHQEFNTFLKSAPQLKSFKECCRKDEYTYQDNCDSRPTHLQRRCGAPNTISRPLELKCPEDCQIYNAVKGDQLNLDKNQGTVRLKKRQNKNATIKDYCAAYECNDAEDDYYEDEGGEGGYQMVFHICVCAKKEVLKKEISTSSKIQQCCPKSYITEHDDGNKLKCPGGDETQSNQDLLTCLTDNFIADDQHVVNETHYTLTDFGMKESHDLESNQFCIGQTFEDEFQSDKSLLKHTLFHCQRPCTDGKPCLRKCCADHEMGTQCNEGEADPDNYTMWKNLDPDVKTYAVFQGPSGKKTEYLHQSKCSQQFDLTQNGSEVLLKMRRTEKVYQPHEFCVNFHSDGTLGAKVASTKVQGGGEDGGGTNTFYPYVLMASSLFLLLTIIIYTYYSDKLLNFYTRVVRHFTFVLMICFLLLAIQKLWNRRLWDMNTNLARKHPNFCEILGFIQHYTFLSAFAFMTVMSYEIMLQLKGSQPNAKRYRVNMITGYVIPLFISLCTFITEFSAEDCDPYRPRFNEEYCFFHQVEAKTLWFFVPIGIFLLINSVMFVKSVIIICQTSNQDRERNGNIWTVKMEKFVMYLKLFVGMGFIWTFEIISGLTHKSTGASVWWLTDVLNMSQGFYVFFVFICKRKVFRVICGNNPYGVVKEISLDTIEQKTEEQKPINKNNVPDESA